MAGLGLSVDCEDLGARMRSLQVRATVSGDVDAQHDAQSPTPGNRLVGSVAVASWRARLPGAEQDLRHAAVAEQHHDEGAEEFAQWLFQHHPDPRPPEIAVVC